MGGSAEKIRDDRFYTSLLLGCRRAAPPSIPAPSRSKAPSSQAPSTFTNASEFLPQPPRSRGDIPGERSSLLGEAPGQWTSVPAHPTVKPSRDRELVSATRSRKRKQAVEATGEEATDKARSQQTGCVEQIGREMDALRSMDSPPSEPDQARARSSQDYTSADTPKEDEAGASTPLRATKKRIRKATHTIRKEEKEHLLKELEKLEMHMAELKKRALQASEIPQQSEQDKLIANRVLRDAVQTQQREFAKIQAIMSEYTFCNIRAGSPVQTAICLVRDEQKRRETLLELKRQKLHDAKQFLARRRPNINPCKPLCEDHRYEFPNGDFCSTRFTMIQFEGVSSVRQVFDLLVVYFCNIEISISEKLGHITIREDDDTSGVGITQNCLVSRTNGGLPMESNTVLFSEFYAPDDGPGHQQGHGLIICEFVDDDERHPYHPEERIRRDVSAVLELTAYTRNVESFGKNFPVMPSSQAQEVVVVLTRWVYSKLHYPSFPIPRGEWEELRDNMDRWGETMHRTLVESLKARSTML